MKTVSGRIVSSDPIPVSRAAKILSSFVSAENGASQVVSLYLRRASDAFAELVAFHRELKHSKKHKKHRSGASSLSFYSNDGVENSGEYSHVVENQGYSREIDGSEETSKMRKKHKRKKTEGNDAGDAAVVTVKEEQGMDVESFREREVKVKMEAGSDEGGIGVVGQRADAQSSWLEVENDKKEKKKKKKRQSGTEVQDDVVSQQVDVGDGGAEEDCRKKTKKRKSGEVQDDAVNNLMEQKRKKKRRKSESESEAQN